MQYNWGMKNKISKLYSFNFWQRREKYTLNKMPTFGAIKAGFLPTEEQN